jgi:ABC-2 type transport system permease protein
MKHSAIIGKYLCFSRVAASQELRSRSTLVGRLGFFIVTLLIFSNLWRVIFESRFKSDLTAVDMLWYLVLTEAVVLSIPRLYKEIETEIRSGEITCWLTRPLVYPLALVAKSCGTFLVRLVFIALIGGGFAAIFSKQIPLTWTMLAWLMILIPLAGMVLLVFEAIIGLLTVWFHEADPFFWIWQKFLFILGGLMFPISIYPDWLQQVAAFTPFYATLYGCGRLILDFNLAIAVSTLAQLLFWAIYGTLTLWLVFKKALNSISQDGG